MKQISLRKKVLDWLPSLLLVALMLVARSTLADHYHVPSGSMEYTLQPGDHVVVNKAAYGLRIPFTTRVFAFDNDPERGEVVIFDSPEDGTRLIKRVVAVGGDRVAVRDGRIELNGSVITLPTQAGIEQFGDRRALLNLRGGGGPDMPETIVPDGHVLVLGDARGNSRDGRYFGVVAADELYGRASAVFWRRKDGPVWLGL
jgi:signal peptidase I